MLTSYEWLKKQDWDRIWPKNAAFLAKKATQKKLCFLVKQLLRAAEARLMAIDQFVEKNGLKRFLRQKSESILTPHKACKEANNELIRENLGKCEKMMTGKWHVLTATLKTASSVSGRDIDRCPCPFETDLRLPFTTLRSHFSFLRYFAVSRLWVTSADLCRMSLGRRREVAVSDGRGEAGEL